MNTFEKPTETDRHPSQPSAQPITPIKIILPVLILAGAAMLGYFIINSKPEPEKKTPPKREFAVEVISVQPQSVRLSVTSQGTVRPRVQTKLTAEVAGRVELVSSNFREGGFIRQGEALIQIDPVDYEAAVANAQANLAQAKFNLAQEQALAEQATSDWKDLGRGDASDLALRKPQLEQAEAMITSAEAALKRAQHNLKRTTLLAPYDGRVVEQSVDVGQFAGANSALGMIYATDVVEVFLPLSDAELARLDLPSDLDQEEIDGPKAVISATFGGRDYTWQGHVVRTGATFDQRSRMLDAVVEIENPLAKDSEQPGRPALKPGMYVRAKIEGRLVPDSYVVPRSALQAGDTILIAQPDNTLTQRPVMVTQANTDTVVISKGLSPGERVITSPVEYVVEGMELKVIEP
ncbi:efflux RND transporter periplasmic adaptor subunit [Cerasicoccus arenae]|uniref:Membrane protein n=1 Tax=Cerasicoccus arenae TaxID=424488 RepID=A0A8J3DHX7_9BACT|nr:efflux RND transporter periplasmic adaptor subunit [Cerasicoccus arenae]MBK1858429.1 efflux RND transporter periplasmic adaptor subunit [Cerasicoccus arenae]GHC02509.1 membrane protein [Cerasicoccus arenae]